MKFFVLNGPNLNLLGEREPEIYGSTSLEDINNQVTKLAEERGHQISCFQSNAEHTLIDQIHNAKQDGVDFLLFNPGAYAHTSIALRDALLGTRLPFIEVHISNVFTREEFRQHSYLSDIAVAVISGLGTFGYGLAMLGAEAYLDKIKNK